jgi:hypothetical protein
VTAREPRRGPEPLTREKRAVSSAPDSRDVEALTELLDLTDSFISNEQRARYLLTCNWFVREGVAVATRAAIKDRLFWQERAASTVTDPGSLVRIHGVTS